MKADQFTGRVKKAENGCWEWQGWIKNNGYGGVWFEGRQTYAHRLSYALFVGEIPEGLTIDHLCRNKCCVNPDHLEAVTHLENCFRARKVICKRGHIISEDCYIQKDGQRQCRRCRTELSRKYRRSRV